MGEAKEHNEIWQFVEEKMKIRIPPFIKHVLRYCGYDNYHSISTIEETDFEYFEEQVKKGGIAEFFVGEIAADEILKGSTKTMENFEIIRGHRKLLMAAVTIVKDTLEKNGYANFYAPSPKVKRKAKIEHKGGKLPTSTVEKDMEPLRVRRKKLKFSTHELLNGPLAEPIADHNDQAEEAHERHHKKVLYLKALSCLKAHNPQVYEERFQMIKKKLSEDTMQINKKSAESLQYTARIKCVYCEDRITVFHKLSNSDYGSWNAFNFERHLSTAHVTVNAVIVEGKENADINADDTEPAVLVNEAKSDDQMINPNEQEPIDPKPIVVVVPPNLPPSFLTLPPTNFIGHSSEFLETETDSVNDFSFLPANENYLIFSKNTFADETIVKIEDVSQEVKVNDKMMFRNGGDTKDDSWDENKRIETRNTCSFDSIFFVYSFLYGEDPDFRLYLDIASLFYHCEFFSLVDLHFRTTGSECLLDPSESVSAWKALNWKRNILLKNVFSSNYYQQLPNLKKDNKTLFINCRTGLGEFFSQLSIQNEMLSSAFEVRTCHTCKKTNIKSVPYLSIHGIDSKIENLQHAIYSSNSRNRTCEMCKKTIVFERILNKVLVIDVEPTMQIQKRKTFSLPNLSQSIWPESAEYKLCGVVDIDPTLNHFRAYVKEKTDEWYQYDDLRSTRMKFDCVATEILPFLLFYITNENTKNFKKAVMKKLSSIEQQGRIYDSDHVAKLGNPTRIAPNLTGNDTNSCKEKLGKHEPKPSKSEWHRMRENGWRY